MELYIQETEPFEKTIEEPNEINDPKNPKISSNIYQVPWIDFKHNLIHREKNETHVSLLTNVFCLSKIEINNWKLNRPVDKTRIPDIIKNNKEITMLPGIIYLFKENNKYFCYDGIHRISSFGGLNPDCRIIVDILLDPSEGTIVDNFKNINKSIPVPELYTPLMYEYDKKKVIQKVVEYYMETYPSHFSPKRNYNIPNCNRDSMIDMILEISKTDDKYLNFTFNEWKLDLGEREKQIKNNILNKKYKISLKQLEKCKKNNFYLFIDKNWNLLYL